MTKLDRVSRLAKLGYGMLEAANSLGISYYLLNRLLHDEKSLKAQLLANGRAATAKANEQWNNNASNRAKRNAKVSQTKLAFSDKKKQDISRKLSKAWNYNKHNSVTINKRRSSSMLKHLAAESAKHKRLRYKKVSVSISNVWKNKTQSERLSIGAKISSKFGGRSWSQSGAEALFGQFVDCRSFKYIGCFPKDGSNDQNLKYRSNIPVSADWVCWSKNLLVFIDGCFYHECPKHGSGYYPDKPIRDAHKTKIATDAGWLVLRIWEHDLRKGRQHIQNMLARY